MPETMRREDEARLVRALSDVAEGVDAGLHPDAAIAKAAAAHDVPCGHVPLLVQAFNIGRTARQRDEGATPAEKAAEFPLASAAAVLDRLFPAAVKSAGAAVKSHRVSAEYHAPPLWYGRHRGGAAGREALEKAASAAATPAEPACSEEWTVRRTLADCDRRDRAAAAERLSVTALEGALVAKFAALTDYFRTPGSLPVVAVRDNVVALHGDVGMRVLAHVVREHPHLAKAAQARGHRHAVAAGLEPYATVAAVLDAARALHDAADRADRVAAWAAEKNAAARAAIAPPRLRRSVLDGDEGGVKRANLTGGIGYAIGNDAFQALGRSAIPTGDDGAAAASKMLSRIATPEHEQQLAEIEARAHLSRLLNDDDVLRGQDPDEVAEHYNRISEFAPVLSRRPLMATPLVRKSVQQGQLDTFEAKEVADAERTLRDIHHPRPEPPAPAPQPGGQKRASRSVLD